MRKRKKQIPFLGIAVGIFLLLTGLSRLCGVLYSSTATDIQYSETWIPTVLMYLQQMLSAFSIGVMSAFAVVYAYNGAGKRTLALIWSCGAVLLADVAAAFCIDWFTNTLDRAAAPIAAVSLAANWLCGMTCLFIMYFCIQHAAKKSSPPSPCRIAWKIPLIYLVQRLLFETVYLIQFLIEVDFMPYMSEIWQILSVYFQIVLVHGALPCLSSFFLYRLLDPAPEDNP